MAAIMGHVMHDPEIVYFELDPKKYPMDPSQKHWLFIQVFLCHNDVLLF